MALEGGRRMSVELNVEILRETDKAFLIVVDAGKEYWIPKSQIDSDESNVDSEGDKGILVVTDWIAEEKGLV